MTTLARTFLVAAAMLAVASLAWAEAPEAIETPSIDMGGYLRVAAEAAAHRERHRVGEREFARLAQRADTVILDARSREKYDLLHVSGAINLSFPDIAVASLQERIPDPSTRILICCNNNFADAPDAFPTKPPGASLNLSTFIALYAYGYRNVWELAGPPIDPARSLLSFEGTEDLP